MLTVPAAKRGNSNTPIGPFQTTVLAGSSALRKGSTVCGPMSRMRQPGGMDSTPTVCMAALASKASAITTSTGSSRWSWPRASNSRRGFEDVFLDQRVAHKEALGLKEGVGHAAADQQQIGLVQKRLDHADLV